MSIPAAAAEQTIDRPRGRARRRAVAVVFIVVAAGCRVPHRAGTGAVLCRLQPRQEANFSRRLVDVGGDVRPSWVTEIGASLVIEAEIPDGGELRFACTVDPDPAHPVTFRVWADAGEAERHQLWEWTFEPAAGRIGRTWHEAAIRPGSSAGRAVRLHFETDAAAVGGADTGAVAWAVPRLVAPVRSDPRPNIVLIVIDTLRADHVSLYGYQRQTTPGIDAWARRRGVVFESAVAQAPWTLPSHVSLFTGLDTLSHGLNFKETVPDTITTLAELLADTGYVTKAITGGAYLGPGSGLMQGFDSLEHWFPGDADRDQRANDIAHNTDRALHWLAECDERPFFLLFHTYEVHAPYRAREPFFSRFHGSGRYPQGLMAGVSLVPPEPASGFQERYTISRVFRRAADGAPVFRAVSESDTDQALVHDLYDAGVAFADAHVTRLLGRLAEPGLEEQTAVILTSDHGESLGENGLAGHCSLAPAELLVPLVVALPNGAHGGATVDPQVRLVDVAPTVLELAGVAAPPGLDGTSLLPLLTGRSTAFPEEAWSYAASSNHGVALRLSDRIQYTFNDSALPPLHGREELEVLGGDERGHSELERAQLRQRVWSALDRRLGGVRVELRSHGPHPLRCTLYGRLVEPNRVKAVTLPEESVRWVEGALEITVDPGGSVAVSLQGRVAGRLVLDARAGDTTLEHTLELAQLKGAWQAAVAASGWEIDGAAGDGARTAIRVWIHGPPPGDSGSQADLDEQTLQQLRQLGYLW